MKHDYTNIKKVARLDTLYKCRCSRCGHRATMRGRPDYKEIAPLCRCGSRTWRVDWFRQARKENNVCNCECGMFPHRAGSCDTAIIRKYVRRYA